MADRFGKPDAQAFEGDITSEIEYQDYDFYMDKFVNELVKNTIAGVKQDIADEQTAEASVTFNLAKLARDKMGRVSMDSVSRGCSPVDNKIQDLFGSDGESDFEDFLASRQSSIKQLLRSVKQLECTTLPSSRHTFSETSTTLAKPTQTTSSEHGECKHRLNSVTLPSEIPRVGSVSSIRDMFERSNIQLYKSASDISALKIRHTSSIVDVPEVQSGKVNYTEYHSVKINSSELLSVKLHCPEDQSIKDNFPAVQSNKVRSVNRPISQSDKVVNELKQLFEAKEREKLNRNIRLTQDELEAATIGSRIMSDASLKSCSTLHNIFEKVKRIPSVIEDAKNIPLETALMVNGSIHTTPAEMANELQQHMTSKISKKPSFVKRASGGISSAMRGMTRLFTSCSSSRCSTGKNDTILH